MITQAILNVIMIPLFVLIDLLPGAVVTTLAYIEPPQIVKYGAYFFPLDVLGVVITGFGLWYTVLLGWAIIEWIYKKIPGVD